jgi:hypothetical protein
MKLIKNDLYEKYTKTVINFQTDLSKLTKDDLYDIFKFHCINMRVLSEAVDYFYELIQKDNLESKGE